MALYLRGMIAALQLWVRRAVAGRYGRLGLALVVVGVALALGRGLWLSAQPAPGPCTGADACLEPTEEYPFLGRAVEPDEVLGQRIDRHGWDFKYNGVTFGSDPGYTVAVDCTAGNCNENCNDHPDPAQAHIDCSLVDTFSYDKPVFFSASNTVFAAVALRGADSETPPSYSPLQTRRAKVAFPAVAPSPDPSDLKVTAVSSNEFQVSWYDVIRATDGYYELNVDDTSTPVNPDSLQSVANSPGLGTPYSLSFTGIPTHTYRAWAVPVYVGSSGLLRRQSFPLDPLRYAQATLPANAPPVITITPLPAATPPHYVRTTSTTFTLNVTAIDPEGNSTTLRATTLPAGSTFPTVSSPIGSAASTFTWNPSTGGDFALALNAFDPFGATTTSVTIRVNRGPGVATSKLASTTPPGALTQFPSSETVTAEYYDANRYDRNNAFTFIFDDPDSADVASAYQFQLASTSLFTTILNSNSGNNPTSIPVGTRSSNILYLGTTDLNYDYEYFWRVRTWDRYSLASPWSVGKVKVRNPVLPNVPPTLNLNPAGPTLSVNRGQTLTINLTATPPEGTQTVGITSTTPLPSPRMTFTPSGPNATFTFTPTADDLAPASPYTVQFCATDSGTPPMSTCQTVTITVNLNLSVPTNLNVYFRETTLASSTWIYGASETEDGFRLRRTNPGPVYSYDAAANTSELYPITEYACSNSLTVDYSLTAYARKSDGSVVESTPVTRTGVSRPGFDAPTNLVRIPDGPSSATITWQHFADPRPGRSGYVVYDNGMLKATVTSPFQTSVNLTGLVPGVHQVVVRPYVDIASCSPSRIQGQSSMTLIWMQPGLSVKFTPTPFDFGDVELTSNRTMTFEVANDGSDPITFDVANTQDIKGVDETDFSLQEPVPATLPGGTSWFVDFKFTPSRLGGHVAEFSVYDSTYGLLGTVPLIGNGIPASVYSVELTPTSLDFGSQMVGSTSGQRPIDVTNNGTVPLVIQAVTMTPQGPNAGAFTISNAPPASLAVGNTWTPQFTFSPTTTGANTAQFRVVVQTAGQIAMAPLTGNGTPATVSDPNLTAAAWTTPNRVRMAWTYPLAENEDGFEASVGTYPTISTVAANALSYDLNITSCYSAFAVPQAARLRAFRGPVGPSRVYSNTSTFEAGVRAGFAAPTGVTATFISPTSSRVSWTVATTSNAGFNIIRNGTTIGTVGPAVTTYTDTPLAAGTYTYGVQPYVTVPGCATPPTGATGSAAAYTHPTIAFALAPNPLNVGSTPVGTPITATFNLTNNSSVPLTMSLNAFTGAQAAAFSLVSPPVNPIGFNAGQTRTFTVQLNPTVFGTNSAQLPITYTYSGVTNPALTLDVTGTGTLAAPTGLTGTWIDPETLKYDWLYSGSGHSGFQMDLGGLSRSATTSNPVDRSYTWNNLGSSPCYTNVGASHSLSVRAYRSGVPITYSAPAPLTLNSQRPGWEPMGSPYIEYIGPTTGVLRWTDPPASTGNRYVVQITQGGNPVFNGTTTVDDMSSMNVTGLVAGGSYTVTMTPRRVMSGCSLNGTPTSFTYVQPDFRFYINHQGVTTYTEATSVDLRGVPRFECAKVWGVVRNLAPSNTTINSVPVTQTGGTASVTLTPALPPSPFPNFNPFFAETTQWRVDIEICPSTASSDIVSTVKLHGNTAGDVLSIPIRVYSDLDAAPSRGVFVTTGTHTGSFGATPVDAMAAADAFCNADTNPARNPSKAYRGLLWFNDSPSAIEPQIVYTLASTSQFLFGTDLVAELPTIAQVEMMPSLSAPSAWTGHSTSTETGPYDCADWSSTAGRGQAGFPGRNRNGQWLVYPSLIYNCNLAYPIYCVERAVSASISIGGSFHHGDWNIGIGPHIRLGVISHSGDPVTVTQIRFGVGTGAEFTFNGSLPVTPFTMTGSDSFILGVSYDPVDDNEDLGTLELVTNELGVLTAPMSGTGVWSGKRLTVTQQRLPASFLQFGDPRTVANGICQSDPWAGNGEVTTQWEALLRRGGTWLNPRSILNGVTYVTGHGHVTPDTVLFTAGSDNDTTKPLPVPLGDSARSWVWAGDGPNDCLGWSTVNPARFGAAGTGWSVGWPVGDRTQWFRRTSAPTELGCNVSTFPIYCAEQ